MKKLLLWGTLVGLSGWIPAQAQKGTTYWGGTVSFKGKTDDNRVVDGNQIQKNEQHTFAPELQWGKFVNPTTMLGVGTAFSFSWESKSQRTPTLSNRTQSISHSIGLLPFIRKYKVLGERWAVFLHGEIGPTYNWYGSKNDDSNQIDGQSHQWRYGLSVKPGLVYYFPKHNLAIEGYADVISLNARYSPFKENSGREFRISSGISTRFPSYFTIRLAKYIPSNEK